MIKLSLSESTKAPLTVTELEHSRPALVTECCKTPAVILKTGEAKKPIYLIFRDADGAPSWTVESEYVDEAFKFVRYLTRSESITIQGTK